jgi:hypothetical protein
VQDCHDCSACKRAGLQQCRNVRNLVVRWVESMVAASAAWLLHCLGAAVWECSGGQRACIAGAALPAWSLHVLPLSLDRAVSCMVAQAGLTG